MTPSRALFTLTVGITLLLCSCEGPAGPSGPMGPAGLNGNANVLPTSWTINPWSAGSSTYYADLTDNNLNANILTYGATEVFMSIDGGNSFEALPFTVGAYSMNYITSLNLVDVVWSDNNGFVPPNYPDPNTYYSANCEIKIVDIASSVMKQHPGTNWKNWSQVNAIIQAQKPANQ